MFVSTFLINTVVQSVLLLFGAHLIQHHRLKADVLLAFMLYQGQLQVSLRLSPKCHHYHLSPTHSPISNHCTSRLFPNRTK